MIRRKVPKGTNFDDKTDEEIESWINDTHAGYTTTALPGSFSQKSWKSWLNIIRRGLERLAAVAALKLRLFQRKGVYKAGTL